MNKFKKIYAIIVAVCTLSVLLVSCDNNSEKTDSSVSLFNSTKEDQQTVIVTDDNGETSIETVHSANKSNVLDKTVTKKEEITVMITDKKGGTSVSVSEKVVVIPVATTRQTSPSSTVKPATTKNPKVTKASTTKKQVINDTINEKAIGISLLSKSDPVECGNHATIFIQGTPGKTYSIVFYKSPSEAADYSALKDKKADANGFVSWSFKITESCSLGKRKVVIKENNSSNYIETSITVK